MTCHPIMCINIYLNSISPNHKKCTNVSNPGSVKFNSLTIPLKLICSGTLPITHAHLHTDTLAPTCFGRIPLNFHPIESLCRWCAFRQRWAACLQVRCVQRWQRVWASRERAWLLMPSAISRVGILQLTQRGGTIPLAVLRHHRGGNIARVHQRAALWEPACRFYFLVKGVMVVCRAETLGCIAWAAGRVGPVSEAQWAHSSLVWLVRDAFRRSPARHESVIRPAVVDWHRAGLESCNPVVRVERSDRTRAAFTAHHRVI